MAGPPDDEAVAATLAATGSETDATGAAPATATIAAAHTPATAATIAAAHTPATAATIAAAHTPATAATIAADRPAAGPSAPRDAHGEAGARYALGALIGRGGMGEVRLARDERVGREVAIKSLTVAGAPSPEAVARFLREARVQGRLDHPAIVPVHDLGFDAHGVPYFAMKRLAGLTLSELIARQAAGDAEVLRRWPRRTLLARLVDLGHAIEFAHSRGVVHRDLKPHNVMLGDFGEVYVLDWGIAKIGEDEAPAGGGGIQRSDLDTLDSVIGATEAGAVLGTPGYMPPEQARGGAIDHRVDVFALGAILFEILALEPLQPRGAGLAGARDASAGHPATRRPDRDIPPELDAACARATAPDPRHRTPSVAALIDELQRFLDGDRDLARRRELADEHATAAAAHLAAGQRADAMRQAGRALALDPAHDGAAALVGRLLLEPPAEPPPEIEAAVIADRERASRPYLRVGAAGYLVYLALVPGVLLVGVREWIVPALLVALALVNAGFAWRLAHDPGDPARNWIWALLSDGVMVALTATFFSPLLMTPGLAMASALAFLTFPARRSAVAVLVAAVLVMLVPLALEWTGVLPSTIALVDGAIVIRSWVLELDGRGVYGVLIGANLGMLLTLASMVLRLRVAQDAQTRRNLLLTWHLRQLVPEARGAELTGAARATPAAASAPPTAAR